MRWQIPLVVALVAFVAVSCDQQPVEPPQEAAVTIPSFDFSNGPTHPGNSKVFRYNDMIVEGWLTEDDDLWAYAYSEPGACPITAEWELVSLQSVETYFDEGPPLWMDLWKGNLNVLVGTYPISCDNVVAYGTAKYLLTDNDALAWVEGRDRNRTNAYGWKVNGSLTMMDGSRAQVHAMYREVWTGAPDYAFKNLIQEVSLH
jgi:hypothetical protein